MSETQMYYNPDLATDTLIVRYAIGSQEREAVVRSNGHSLKDHVERLQGLRENAEYTSKGPAASWAPWTLATGGGIFIRLDSIIAIEAP
ncbi:hypothetical protein ACFW9S_38105 [Streptomyces anulatus]|uniref:hypothetical protein n=1 Tax=Streptomycetaceae TaxID=2062 RepID=UPI0036592A3A